LKALIFLIVVVLATATTGCQVTPIRDLHGVTHQGGTATVLLGRNNDDAGLYSAIKKINGSDVATDTWMYRVPEGNYNLEVWLAVTEGSDFGAFLSIYGGISGGFKLHKFLYRFDQAQFEQGQTYRLKLEKWSKFPKILCFETRPSVHDEVQQVKGRIAWPSTTQSSCGKFVKKL